ncbi:hypothetical protein [Spirosoma validum]|uniref:Uncharacterized protein n=1 Tax=Spirosoma validum TaxID=2771355 RepID=A0A927B126_9BACT|nr:hypothetical protein [Spirosoma validum]MBD2753463.1 hypothetical protein [Spirosoma validum]
MANSYIGWSFRNLIILAVVFGFLTTGCKKSGGSDPEIDPRDQYVGTYTGTYRNSIYNVEDLYDEPKAGTATVTITKGSNPKEIYVEILTAGDRTGNRTLKVTADLDGVNFTVNDKNTDTIPLARPVDGDYTAAGVFDPSKNQFSYSSVTRATRNGAQYKQTYEVVCTKQ